MRHFLQDLVSRNSLVVSLIFIWNCVCAWFCAVLKFIHSLKFVLCKWQHVTVYRSQSDVGQSVNAFHFCPYTLPYTCLLVHTCFFFHCLSAFLSLSLSLTDVWNITESILQNIVSWMTWTRTVIGNGCLGFCFKVHLWQNSQNPKSGINNYHWSHQVYPDSWWGLSNWFEESKGQMLDQDPFSSCKECWPVTQFTREHSGA